MNPKAVIIASLVFLICTGAFAQDSLYRYDVKFACGRSNGTILSTGNYRTAINIINPNRDTVLVRSVISVALANSPGMISNPVYFKLGPNQSREIDCPEVLNRTPVHDTFRKGFVIVHSARSLDIVAVYTASGNTNYVESIHTERVPALRQKQACKDVVVLSIEKVMTVPNQQLTIEVKVANFGEDGAPVTTDVRLNYGPAGGPLSTMTLPVTIPAGGTEVVTFMINYSVTNPQVFFEAFADSTNAIRECREDNNIKKLQP